MYIRLDNGFYIVGGGNAGPGISNFKDCNVYLLTDKDQAFLIDSGSGLNTPQIFENIAEAGCPLENIKYLFITHSHGDHAGGIVDFQAAIKKCRVVASREESRLIREGTEFEMGLTAAKHKGAYPQDYRFRHTGTDLIAENLMQFSVGEITITALIIPGHSIESVCYLVEKSARKILFSGDTLYLNGVLSVINCYGSSMEAYRNHLPKLAGLNIDALIPSHFGFTLTNGQSHIDKAIEYLKSSSLPPMM